MPRSVDLNTTDGVPIRLACSDAGDITVTVTGLYAADLEKNQLTLLTIGETDIQLFEAAAVLLQPLLQRASPEHRFAVLQQFAAFTHQTTPVAVHVKGS